MRSVLLIVGIVFATLVNAQERSLEGIEAPSYRVSPDVFAGDLRGPYLTGTYEEMWVDERRDDPATSDPSDKRRLMVQIWYPAAISGNPQRAPYMLHGELYSQKKSDNWLNDVKTVRTTSVLKAPLVARPSRLPVLIYNPGGGHPAFSGTFQTEFLASHGYVVVAIGHTDLTGIERFPDGHAYEADVAARLEADLDKRLEDQHLVGVDAFNAEEDHYSTHMIPLHVKDIVFALDRLETMNATRGNRFHNRLDLEKVGSLGWSLGGALSFQASGDEPRIKAAINLDGSLSGDVHTKGTHRPIMMMHSGALAAPRFKTIAADDYLIGLADEALRWQLYGKSDADWYDVTLRRTHHGHFSDRTLFEAADNEMMHPRLAHDIVNAYTLEFFNKYLRGDNSTPLLSGKLGYPDVEVRAKPSK